MSARTPQQTSAGLALVVALGALSACETASPKPDAAPIEPPAASEPAPQAS